MKYTNKEKALIETSVFYCFGYCGSPIVSKKINTQIKEAINNFISLKENEK